MPGPKATIRTKRDPAPNTPARKVAARLAARIKDFSAPADKYRGGFKMPGSQNRKK